MAAAGFFGPEAVAKVTRLTVRKLYQREYHFFDSDGKGGWPAWRAWEARALPRRRLSALWRAALI